MYSKLYLIPLTLSILLFSACSNKVIGKETNATQRNKENETIKESSFIGKVVVGTFTFLATKNLKKSFEATKFGGTASGYFIGKKLSNMQKKYKDKEEMLISKIINIDQESVKLQTKNIELNKNLLELEQNLELVKKSKAFKKSEKKSQELLLKNNFQEKKEKLQIFLNENHKLSQKISSSKAKVNEYNYSKEDKKELLKSVSFLEKITQDFDKEINNKLSIINKLIKTI